MGDGERGLEELLAPVTGRINTAVNNAILSYQPQRGSAHTDRWLGDDFLLELDHPQASFSFIMYSRWAVHYHIFVYKNTVFCFLRFNVNSNQVQFVVIFTKYVFSMQFYRKSILKLLIYPCLVTFSRLNTI